MKIVINIQKEVYDRILKAKSVPDILGVDIVNVINAVKDGSASILRESEDTGKIIEDGLYDLSLDFANDEHTIESRK